MILLLSFCSFPWWLAWLLPFLLGLILGWAIWSKYKSQAEERAEEISSLLNRISSLEGDLEDCKRSRIEARGRIAELETELKAAIAASSTDVEDVKVGLAEAIDKGADLEISDTAKDLGGLGLAANLTAPLMGASADIYAGLARDDLQIIEGIGPKMESVLKENGITNWSSLAAKSPDELNGILAKYGQKYTRIIDPKTWPQQAALARDRKWENLIALQKDLDTGKTGSPRSTDSKLEKRMIKMGLLRKFKQDDLKAVEGIGPKIQGLLHDAGITTWLALSETNIAQIQQILDAAGPRYKLADPGSWPRQAGLAALGKWQELQALQDKLDGGK